MNYESITYPDVNNGVGCRVTLWVSGCSHHCPGCHNQCTWDFKSGQPFTDEVKDKICELLELPYIDGLTLSGGDPMDSAEELIPFVEEVTDRFNGKNKTIWLYTGYTLEQIMDDPVKLRLLHSGIHVVVDGPYIEAKRNITLPFRGSTNQRIWTVRMDGSYREIKDIEFDNEQNLHTRH